VTRMLTPLAWVQIATHGAWVSSKHRVVNHAAAAEDRLSLLFFFSFNPDVVPFTLLPVRPSSLGFS
jgi:isopenicillin N synthase-like dioxygenase